MFIGVETDERGKALDMSFKQIGIPARKVIAEAELAARASKSRSNWNEAGSGEATASMQPTTGGIGMGGGTPVREDADVPPRRSNPRGQVRATENGKGRGTVKATASVRGSVERPGGTAVRSYGQRMKPAVWLVASTGMPSVNRRPKASGHAAPALGRPVLVVVGGTHYTASGSF